MLCLKPVTERVDVVVLQLSLVVSIYKANMEVCLKCEAIRRWISGMEKFYDGYTNLAVLESSTLTIRFEAETECGNIKATILISEASNYGMLELTYYCDYTFLPELIRNWQMLVARSGQSES